MVMFRRSKSARPVDGEWHQRREEARRTAFSVNEFGPAEISKFNLDTARITGEDNPLSYTIDRPIDTLGENGRDIREDKNR